LVMDLAAENIDDFFAFTEPSPTVEPGVTGGGGGGVSCPTSSATGTLAGVDSASTIGLGGEGVTGAGTGVGTGSDLRVAGVLVRATVGDFAPAGTARGLFAAGVGVVDASDALGVVAAAGVRTGEVLVVAAWQELYAQSNIAS
jgi:hypothetical protein